MDKIQVLIDNGFITLDEVLIYAYNHNALEELNEDWKNSVDETYYDPSDDYLDDYTHEDIIEAEKNKAV